MPSIDKASERLKMAHAELDRLLVAKNTLVLGTLDEQGLPDAGLTPFLYQDRRFYVFISNLASHTRNLRERPHVSVLIHKGDESARNPFTDKRVSFKGRAFPVTEADKRDRILEVMEDKLGKTVSLLRSLPDFALYEITPTSGQLVVGFGAAFEVDTNDWSLHPVEAPSSQ